MFRLLAALLVLLLPCLLRAQTPLFQVLDAPVPRALGGVEAVADFDGDGDLDLLGPGGIAVNDGHCRFTLAPTTGLSSPRGRTVAGDLNGDGLADVVSLNTGVIGSPIRIDLNLGGFAFSPPVAALPAIPSPYYAFNFALGDVDADGDADILIGTGGGLGGLAQLWVNDGTGAFSSVPPGVLPGNELSSGYLALRDLDGDGDLDALFGNAVLTNTGTSLVITQTLNPSAYVEYPVELGNFNGDAFSDIVVGLGYTASGITMGVQLGSATGFLAPVTSPLPGYPIWALDLNGDGLDEIVIKAWPTTSVRSVTAGGVISAPTQSWNDLALIQAPSAEVIRDLDGDGDRDVLATTGNGDVVLLMSDGTGSLVRVGGRMAGLGASMIQVGDLDADGDRDLVAFTGWMGTALADGDGFFTSGVTIQMVPLGFQSVLPDAYSLYTFDRDGDGDADLLLAPNVLSAFYPVVGSFVDNAGGGLFTTFALLGTSAPTSAFRAADFDGDGDQDLVMGRRINVAGIYAGPMDYFQNLGAAGFAPPVAIGARHVTYDLAVADFDGNGALDVFQANKDVPNPGGFDPSVLYLNAGGGNFTAFPTVFSSSFVAAGDLNGDGLPDVVIDSFVLFNAGGGALNPGPQLAAPLLGPATLVDVDGDGDLDIVETPATVMFNNGAALFGPPVSYLPRATGPYLWGSGPESAVFDVDRDGDLDIAAPGPLLLMNTTRQIAHGSIARPGRPASIELYGTPGGAWFLWGSAGTASLPLQPWGTVLIDPASAQLGAMGTFTGPTAPLPGTATVSVLVPNNPALIGWTTYWQSVDAAQMRLTNRIPITVLGY